MSRSPLTHRILPRRGLAGIPPSRESWLMRTPLWLFVSLIWIVTASACTSVAESSASVEFSDSAGVRIVHSRGPKWREGEAWSVSAEPRQSIGVVDGPVEYQFVELSSAARRSDGKVVVVDRGTRTVRLYDGEGSFLKTLGGPGSGPGEFQDPGSGDGHGPGLSGRVGQGHVSDYSVRPLG